MNQCELENSPQKQDNARICFQILNRRPQKSHSFHPLSCRAADRKLSGVHFLKCLTTDSITGKENTIFIFGIDSRFKHYIYLHHYDRDNQHRKYLHFRFKFKDFRHLLQCDANFRVCQSFLGYASAFTIQFAWGEVTCPYFDSELKFLMHPAFADTFHLHFTDGIKLLLIAFLLIEKTFAKFKQFLQFQAWSNHPPFYVLKNPSRESGQLFRRFSRLLELIGFCLTVLAVHNFPRSVRKYTACNTVFTCGFYQTFTQLIVKPDICWIAYGFCLVLLTFTQVSSVFWEKPSRSPVCRTSLSIFLHRFGQAFCAGATSPTDRADI